MEQCAPRTLLSPTAALWKGAAHRDCGDQSGRLTCGHKEDAGTEDDVVLAAVEPPGSDAEPPEQEQDGAEDGEDAGGANDA